jgi:hypothetical protein
MTILSGSSASTSPRIRSTRFSLVARLGDDPGGFGFGDNTPTPDDLDDAGNLCAARSVAASMARCGRAMAVSS